MIPLRPPSFPNIQSPASSKILPLISARSNHPDKVTWGDGPTVENSQQEFVSGFLASPCIDGGGMMHAGYWLEFWWMFPVALGICITV
jgi:hypothetical protein